MTDIGKTIIVVGGAIVLIGVIVLIAGKLGFKGLPGDVAYQDGNVRFYSPLVSCLVLSVLLTLGMWIYRWLTHR